MEEVLAFIRKTEEFIQEFYQRATFYTERDIVWTFQQKLNELITDSYEGIQVFNDYGILKGNRRSISTDIAIAKVESQKPEVLVAIEFKYEPDNNRKDIPSNKFPVINWSGYRRDIDRVNQFVNEDKAKIGIAYLFDEGKQYSKKYVELRESIESSKLGSCGKLIKYTTSRSDS
ncbi:MAG: hypothetical protein U5Q03_05445 [Bacteroidota bacterium]|nr:hypothetical protein [Bacteroidota bacterium]